MSLFPVVPCTKSRGDLVENLFRVFGLHGPREDLLSAALKLLCPRLLGAWISLLAVQAEEQFMHEAGAVLHREPQRISQEVVRTGHADNLARESAQPIPRSQTRRDRHDSLFRDAQKSLSPAMCSG